MKIPAKIRRVALLEKKSLITRGLKLCEEAGELAAEILKYEGEKGSKGKNREQILYDMHLECIDCYLMIMDILVKSGATNKRINTLIDQQLAKWENWLKRKKK